MTSIDPGSVDPGAATARRRPATMEDVAAVAGVSRALVSIVLRDVPGASAESRERVLRAAGELGYRVDRRARLLGRVRTRLIGVVFGVQHAFHGDLVEALYASAEPQDYDIALSAVAPTRDERRAVETLLDYRCEALILLGPTLSAPALSELARTVPTVVVARQVTASGVDVVRTDDADGLRQAVEHLVHLGHRRIAHVGGGSAPGAAQRLQGYRAAMRAVGAAGYELLLPGGLTEDDGASAVRGWDGLPEPPTALAVFNDRCATGVLEALRLRGLRVPQDVSVVGFDDDRLARLSHVDLTTVRQDAAEMARLAVRGAVEQAADGRPGGRRAVVRPTLVVRGTTGPSPRWTG